AVFARVADKIEPVGRTINIGGGTETPNASNLNPMLPGTGGPTSGIPNLVKGFGEQIAEFFKRGSAERIIGSRLPYGTVQWERLAKGASEVAAPGARVMINTWVQGTTPEQAVARDRLVDAFRNAGFENVSVIGEGAGTLVRAVKPAVE